MNQHCCGVFVVLLKHDPRYFCVRSLSWRGFRTGYDFPRADEFKLHSFRHHFASLCANHAVTYRKALAWLGHSDSSILELYYHLSDSDSQAAMQSLASDHLGTSKSIPCPARVEGNLRAMGQSKIEKTPEDEDVEGVMKSVFSETEYLATESNAPVGASTMGIIFAEVHSHFKSVRLGRKQARTSPNEQANKT